MEFKMTSKCIMSCANCRNVGLPQPPIPNSNTWSHVNIVDTSPVNPQGCINAVLKTDYVYLFNLNVTTTGLSTANPFIYIYARTGGSNKTLASQVLPAFNASTNVFGQFICPLLDAGGNVSIIFNCDPNISGAQLEVKNIRIVELGELKISP